MWYLLEASNGKFSVVYEMREMDPWKLRESKEGDPEVVCGRQCRKQVDGLVEPVEQLCEEVETVRSFCYLGNRVNASGGCEAAVTARARIGWVKFKECGELLNSKRFLLKMKGMVYWSCVRLAMLYGSETWCLRYRHLFRRDDGHVLRKALEFEVKGTRKRG